MEAMRDVALLQYQSLLQRIKMIKYYCIQPNSIEFVYQYNHHANKNESAFVKGNKSFGLYYCNKF